MRIFCTHKEQHDKNHNTEKKNSSYTDTLYMCYAYIYRERMQALKE